MLHGGKIGKTETIVPADWLQRCITPTVSCDEIRRYGYQWFMLDIAFGKPKGWAVGRLERMWMGPGRRRSTPVHHPRTATRHRA